MNIMEADGCKAKIEYDPELDEFRGEVLGLNGSLGFYGKSPAAFRKEFRDWLKVFMDGCEGLGIVSMETDPLILLFELNRLPSLDGWRAVNTFL